MNISANGRRLIQSFEGLSLKAYPDATGYSIGYGHFGASAGDEITRDQADRYFDQDVAKFELAVSLITPRAAQHEFDAMVSLAYNIGTGNTKTRSNGFAGSTVARLHNLGDRQGAADAFRMWNKSGGKVLPVLTDRREKERAVYLHGYAPFSGGGAPQPGKPPAAPVAASSAGSKALAASGGLALLIVGLGLALLMRGR